MRSVAFITILFLVGILNVFAHPIHVSIVNIDVKTDSNRIDYSIRLFYDDFQAIINSKYKTSLDFEHEKRISIKEQQYILDYLHSSFYIGDSAQQIKAEFIGWKIEDMSLWFYFDMDFRGLDKKLIIENTLMNDLFTDQKNLLILNYKGKEQGIEFNQRKTRQEILLY